MNDLRIKFINLKEKLNSRQFRKVWLLDSFDKKSQQKTIMAEMPEYDVYLANKIKKEVEKKEACTEFTFMYIEPFLTKPQEYHLFRKYNFIKYKYKNLVEETLWTKTTDLSRVVRTLEKYYAQMNELKQRISLSNARLVMNIAKKMQVANLETALSDGYLGLITAVDYFDFRRNIKFITYGYLVIKDYIRKQRYEDSRSVAAINLDEMYEVMDSHYNEVEENLLQDEVSEIINNCLNASTTTRQKDIIVDYYGLNGKSRLTLDQISQKIGVTKERVRQIKMAGEEKLKNYGIKV